MVRVPRKDDRSADHLRWLVEKRSANQHATLELFVALTQNESTINSNIIYANLSQELAGIAFSLWRAVFLSDLTEALDEQILDMKSILGNLISNNSIGYSQDRGAREWTFQYYLTDAQLRLQTLARQPPGIIDQADVDRSAGSAKEDWEITQNALERAIHRFSNLTRLDHDATPDAGTEN